MNPVTSWMLVGESHSIIAATLDLYVCTSLIDTTNPKKVIVLLKNKQLCGL
jgi:hypothetical protein